MTDRRAPVVIGGASYIGRATVELLRSQGTDVYVGESAGSFRRIGFVVTTGGRGCLRRRFLRLELMLVGASVVVAVLAYIAATGRPDLHAELQFVNSDVNQPVLAADPAAESDALGWRFIGKWRHAACQVVLVNRSRFAARNAGVRIELDGIGGPQEQPGWTDVEYASVIGRAAIQWDGGADYLIHGRWARKLPSLDFDAAFWRENALLRQRASPLTRLTSQRR